MNILYCSSACSNKTITNLSKKYNYPLSSLTIQKFHRLVLNGMVMNEAEVETLSTPPAVSKFYNKEQDDDEEGIRYHYLNTIEVAGIRHFCIAVGAFFKTLVWKRKCRGEHFVVCDVLNISLCMGVLLSRLFGVKVIGLMTDMPGLMVGNSASLIGQFIKKVNLYVLHKFDAYVFLTESMNEEINKRNKPYIVMEGLVDINMKTSEHKLNPQKRNVIYAGGIHERYGLKTLIEAFQKVPGKDIALSIYGRLRGSITEEKMAEYEKTDPRFHYYGVKPNTEIVKEELSAALLVNPRPTHEEFTKYSFPSKNMEYMVSGAPVLTTALPGMPKEYYDKLFVCYDETVDGLADKLSEILHMPDSELIEMGEKGKNFVLKYKNNKIQAERIMQLFKVIK